MTAKRLAEALKKYGKHLDTCATMCEYKVTEDPPEPKCPECGSGVDRPKCMWEMGAACPRHEVREEWHAQQHCFQTHNGKHDCDCGYRQVLVEINK